MKGYGRGGGGRKGVGKEREERYRVKHCLDHGIFSIPIHQQTAMNKSRIQNKITREVESLASKAKNADIQTPS